ncbi:hypothetical protein B0H11DRAFT_2284892 [Mycena galericulata]|nr:hypothetical protein B0H11DRAFT_2284892 [Mycena galericulata]
MEAKYKTPTCSRCKIRRTRCDGKSPCIGCSSVGAECTYGEDLNTGQSRIELRKGYACLPCRRKKKRCNGQSPCHTCMHARRAVHCEYSDGLDVEKSDADGPAHPTDSTCLDSTCVDYPHPDLSETSAASGSSRGSHSDVTAPAKTLNLPGHLGNTSDISSSSPIAVNKLSTSPSISYIATTDLFHARDIFLQDPWKRGLNGTSDMIKATDVPPMPTVAPGLLDSHINSPSPFVQELHAIPNSHEAELFQIRKLFLCHRIQLGLSVTNNTVAAIAQGVTGDMVHPVLLHACQLVGYMLARHLQNDAWLRIPGQCEGEAEQTRLSLASLQHAVTPCPIGFLQTSTLLCLYFINKGDVGRSREILAKAGKMAVQHNLDNISVYQQTAVEGGNVDFGFKHAPANRVAEIQAALSQVLYLDMAYIILLRLPSIIDSRLYSCFKILVANPNTRAETNFVRAKSVYFLREAQLLKAQHHQSTLVGSAASDWQERYWELMEALGTHRSFVALALTKTLLSPALRLIALSLKVCAIITLTGLAELLSLFAAAQSDLRRQRHEVILEIVSMSAAFTEEDCRFLHPILSPCWKAIIGTLDELGTGQEAAVHDLPAMAGVIRERNKTLQRVLPWALDV